MPNPLIVGTGLNPKMRICISGIVAGVLYGAFFIRRLRCDSVFSLDLRESPPKSVRATISATTIGARGNNSNRYCPAIRFPGAGATQAGSVKPSLESEWADCTLGPSDRQAVICSNVRYAMPNNDWRLKGEWLKSCSCDYGCPCDFNARPTQGWCKGLLGMHVTKAISAT